MNKQREIVTIALILLGCWAATVRADIVGLQRVASGLSSPIFVTHAPGDTARLFIVQRGGAIRILNLSSGVLETTPFLTISGVDTEGEGGLLGDGVPSRLPDQRQVLRKRDD